MFYKKQWNFMDILLFTIHISGKQFENRKFIELDLWHAYYKFSPRLYLHDEQSFISMLN